MRVFLNKFAIIAVIAVIASPFSAGAQVANDAERQSLEEQLKKIEAQIDNYENTVENYRTQGRSLQSEISRLNVSVKKLNLQLQASDLSIHKLDYEIAATEDKINETEKKIDLNKEALRDALRNINENDSETLMMVLLKNPSLSNFFADIDNLLAVQDSIRSTVQTIVGLRDDLLNQNEELSLERSDATALRAYQVSQKKSLNDTKAEKDRLLTVTKGQESVYQALLKETKKTAAQIRSRIFELLGGGELTFEDAYKFAKLAEGATGVRAAFILAILDRESALGQNVGRCSYKTSMHPVRDIPLFLNITRELNINPDSVTVSCANADGVYGGAMGPAQFLASTWVLYKDKIAGITGNNPPSPWRNSDAFVATAIYMKDLLDGCSSYSGLSRERCAAAKYYAGRRWTKYLWTYGDRTITRAQQFQRDIDILNS